MNEVRTSSFRNVAIVSSVGAGKTSLAEAILYTTGAIPTLGSVAQGTTVSDFEPEEVHRRSSVSTSLLQCSWQQCTLNLVDPPGTLSLLGEAVMALDAVDAVIVVLDAASGVRTELAKLWPRVNALGLPCLLFINGLDKEGVSRETPMAACARDLGLSLVPLTVPIGTGSQLEGVVDLVEVAASRSRPGMAMAHAGPVPEHMAQVVAEGKKQLHEAAAEGEDRFLEQYLADGELTATALIEGLRLGVQARMFVPCYSGSALKHVGIVPLLNGIVQLLPSPAARFALAPRHGLHPATQADVTHHGSTEEPFSAIVFKTLIDPFVGRLSYLRILSGRLQGDSMVWNASRQVAEKSGHLYTVLGKKHTVVHAAGAGEIVALGKLKETHTGDTLCDEKHPICYPRVALPRPVLSFAIEPKSNADIEKVSLGLHKLIEEDPTLEFSRHADTKEMVLSGMGQIHIDLALEKLRRKYGAEVVLHQPKIPYRETIRASAQAQGKYKKQTGGHGQYGDCWLELTPGARGEGFRFENKVVGGAIPRNFIPAVEKGVVDALLHGTLAGFPVVDVRVAVYDGSHHVVDSSEMAFKIAASMGFKKAMESAHPVLLEPIMAVEIEAPADHIGAVIGDVNARRGRILHVEANDHTETIKAHIPMAELLTYTTTLHAVTGGRGSYAMEFARYDEVPRELAARIVEEQKHDKQTVGAHA